LLEEKGMASVLVLYYPSYGHIEAMAAAVAEDAREVGAQVGRASWNWCPKRSRETRTSRLVPTRLSRRSIT
jgi:hypothetical protein